MAYRRMDNLYSDILTQAQVEQLIELRRRGVTLRQLAEQFDIHKNTVINIIKRWEREHNDKL
jgi:transposase